MLLKSVISTSCANSYIFLGDTVKLPHKGDTVKLPKGKTVHDVTFGIKFTEGCIPYTRSVQVSEDRTPEAPAK